MSGSRSVLSWEPPSGKIPRHPPAAMWSNTCVNAAAWLGLGNASKALSLSLGAGLAAADGGASTSSTSDTISAILYWSAHPSSRTRPPTSHSARNLVPSPVTVPPPSAEGAMVTRPELRTAVSCARMMGMHPIILANMPTSGRSYDACAMRKPTLCRAVHMTTMASKNWFAWLPVKMTGPST